MTKQPRLRVQKAKWGRRVILCLLILIGLGILCYQLEQRYDVVAYVGEVLSTVKKTFSQNTPVRGTIYDRNLKQVAINKERVSVYARNREIESIPDTVTALDLILDLDKEKLQSQLESGVLRFWIAEDISQAQEVSIEGLNLSGVHLQSEAKRFYPGGSQAAHLIGYVDDGIGLSGVEFYYDRLLASRKLKQQEEQKPLVIAQNLVLTLDLKIQTILEEIVTDIKENEKASKVAAYILESQTGEIVGGAQLPGFNPNFFTRYSQKALVNIFLEPLYLPPKFRLLIRDAAILEAQTDTVPPIWSMCADNGDLGSQLRLWERLGLSESEQTDFNVSKLPGIVAVEHQKPVTSSEYLFGLVPEYATPLGLLTAFASLLANGENIHPFVVKKILDIETGVEILLTEKDDDNTQSSSGVVQKSSEMKYLYRSQAREGVSDTFFLRDEILLTEGQGVRHKLLINDLTFITIPAGSNDLNMLVIVQRAPEGVRQEKTEKRDLEEIIEEKLERISVLRQVSKSVADVMEPQLTDDGNFQLKKRQNGRVVSQTGQISKDQSVAEVMPDLKGLSLRKSLRLLKGIPLEINIQGTGRVVDQKPPAGKALKGITECVLVLQKNETINLENFSKRSTSKK